MLVRERNVLKKKKNRSVYMNELQRLPFYQNPNAVSKFNIHICFSFSQFSLRDVLLNKGHIRSLKWLRCSKLFRQTNSKYVLWRGYTQR